MQLLYREGLDDHWVIAHTTSHHMSGLNQLCTLQITQYNINGAVQSESSSEPAVTHRRSKPACDQ